MSAPPETVGERELVFFFQTNEALPAKPLLNFLYEVERIARTQRHLGPSALVEILEIKTGTKLVRLTFDSAAAWGGLAGAVIFLGRALADRIKQPNGRLPESVAEMCVDHGVAECILTTPERQIRITRDEIPAIATVRDKKERLARARQYPSHGASQDYHELEEAIDLRADELRSFETQDLPRQLDGKVYTIVGKLRPPGEPGRIVPGPDWQLDSQSGKTYIARGVDPNRARNSNSATVVVRAEIRGVEGSHRVLNVKDVFPAEEP